MNAKLKVPAAPACSPLWKFVSYNSPDQQSSSLTSVQQNYDGKALEQSRQEAILFGASTTQSLLEHGRFVGAPSGRHCANRPQLLR